MLDEGVPLAVEPLAADLRVDRLARGAPAVERALQAEDCSALATARSKATQAITLEWTNCRRGPRTSQMPSSGSRQMRSR